MVPAKKPVAKDIAIDVIAVSRGEAVYRVIGDTPLIQERMSEKARRELLFPSPPKNSVERRSTLKHNPREEFLAAAYRVNDGPTRLALPASSFKNAMLTAALRLPGVVKTETGQLLYVVGDYVPIWGIPKLLISTVRSADMNRTPDQRTRPIITPWVTEITVRFVEPNFKAQAVSRLLVMAGMVAGVGGWRQEKGSGNYGLFRVATAEDAELFDEVVATGGRDAQDAALADPECYDLESAELLSWYEHELGVRQLKGAA
jgi:hypothetical protein